MTRNEAGKDFDDRPRAHKYQREGKMKMIDLDAAFREFEDEFLKFERVENPCHRRPDVCAFILLDELVPGDGRDMVSAAEHDEIFLDVDCDALAQVATKDDICTLSRCGVRYDRSLDSLAMFV